MKTILLVILHLSGNIEQHEYATLKDCWAVNKSILYQNNVTSYCVVPYDPNPPPSNYDDVAPGYDAAVVWTQ